MDTTEIDEQDIEDEISQQLLALQLDPESVGSESDTDSSQNSNTSNPVPNSQIPETAFLKSLEKRLSSQRSNFEKQLQECSDLLHSAEGTYNL